MKKILIVDDEDVVRTPLIKYIGKNGYSTLEAESGERGLDLAIREVPDLILTDRSMPPGMNGFELCRRLRLDDKTKDVIIIGSTGDLDPSGGDEYRIGFLEAGADDFIQKPYRFPEILQMINGYLGSGQ